MQDFLAVIAEHPCACGKRPHGDQVSPLEPLRVMTYPFLGATIERTQCLMRCDVCGHEEVFDRRVRAEA